MISLHTEFLLSLLEDLEDLHELRIAKQAESDAPCSEARNCVTPALSLD